MMFFMFVSILSVMGGLLVAREDVRGFYIWIVANLLWLSNFGISWIGFMFTVYIFLAIYSIYFWKKTV